MNRLEPSDTKPCAKKMSSVWDVLCAVTLGAPSAFASVFPLLTGITSGSLSVLF